MLKAFLPRSRGEVVMEIFPAIDILDGKAVRLTRGDYNQSEVFAQTPLRY